jgi:nucleoside-diphosphate-sugar epimerase
MRNNQTALIIGATGGIGAEVAAALVKRGWRVRALNRHPHEAARRSAWIGPVEWVEGDAMVAETIIAAASGADLIVHAANPPGYRNWGGLVLPMLESTIAAAKASGARIVLPGTVYNFGPDAGPVLSESSRQNPKTRKGAIRVAMEQRLQEVSRAGVRVLIVRAGDFFGPHTGNSSWFAQGLVKPGKPVRAVTYPGPKQVGHAWAYLPDLAETAVRLIEREAELAPFDVFHFGGHWFDPGVTVAETIRRVVDNPHLPIKRLPWWAVYAAAPFVTTFREMIEMRYLWRLPIRLDNAKLVKFLGAEPHTSADEAIRNTLIGLGCLDSSAGTGQVRSRASGVAA